MIRRIAMLCLAVAFAMGMTCFSVSAEENLDFTVSSPQKPVIVGDEFEVKITLNDYASMTSDIQGIQIDVTSIAPDVLEVVSYSSLVQDCDALSNNMSYSSLQQYVRFVYLNTSEALDKSVDDLISVRFRINNALRQSGSIMIPITFKMGLINDSNTENVVLHDYVTIDYQYVKIIGDADGNEDIEVVDATLIQRYLVQIETPFSKEELMKGDVDNSGDLELTDVTAIQYYLCNLKTPFPIGAVVS